VQENEHLPVVTRSEAKALGLVRYFTGEPCKSGHIDERNVSSGSCLACMRLKATAIRSTDDGRARYAKSKRDHRARNKEKCREYGKRYREDHADEHSARFRRWHESASKDPEYRGRKAAATRRWSSENKGRARLADSIKRARRRNARPADFGELDRLVIEEAFDLARRREEQTGIKWHVDHMVPLSRGGAHSWDNIQVIPAEVNLWKRNRMVFTKPGEWLRFYDERRHAAG